MFLTHKLPQFQSLLILTSYVNQREKFNFLDSLSLCLR